MGRTCWIALPIVGMFALRAAPVVAQTQDTSLRVTVTDATAAVIIGARVVVRQADGSELQAVTGDVGVAVLTGLVPGTVEVRVESDGFEPKTFTDRRLRAGVNRLDARRRSPSWPSTSTCRATRARSSWIRAVTRSPAS